MNVPTPRPSRITPPSAWFSRFSQPRAVEQICADCGHVGQAQPTKRGRDDLEIVLWLMLAVAAVCYVGGYVAHHFISAFPGIVIRFFSLLGKLFLLLSAVYTLWRLSTQYEACPKCEHPAMIPIDTPRGRKLKTEDGGRKTED